MRQYGFPDAPAQDQSGFAFWSLAVVDYLARCPLRVHERIRK
ncbi:hypothetical protein ACVIWV_009254 [Bradyrhizobium diazoefficiens]|uniref:Uncharacterized protein n=1 Tax=Bradyrhizobium diazoefficiens TaxID=1355477 RepID=A0A0E4FV30_9BRAD|nr:hypothetical protein NK6_5313 [Bradyrhizobium diazoefficiens]